MKFRFNYKYLNDLDIGIVIDETIKHFKKQRSLLVEMQ